MCKWWPVTINVSPTNTHLDFLAPISTVPRVLAFRAAFLPAFCVFCRCHPHPLTHPPRFSVDASMDLVGFVSICARAVDSISTPNHAALTIHCPGRKIFSSLDFAILQVCRGGMGGGLPVRGVIHRGGSSWGYFSFARIPCLQFPPPLVQFGHRCLQC